MRSCLSTSVPAAALVFKSLHLSAQADVASSHRHRHRCFWQRDLDPCTALSCTCTRIGRTRDRLRSLIVQLLTAYCATARALGHLRPAASAGSPRAARPPRGQPASWRLLFGGGLKRAGGSRGSSRPLSPRCSSAKRQITGGLYSRREVEPWRYFSS
jgi:hypothetical protein